MQRQYFGFDTETFPFDRARDPYPPMVCAQFYVPGNQPLVVLRRDAYPVLREFFETAIRERITIVAHNLSYDTCVTWRTFPELGDLIWQLYDLGLFECTLLREKLYDIAKGRYDNKTKGRWLNGKKSGYSLLDLIAQHTGVLISKDDKIRNHFGDLDNIPVHQWPHERYKYAADDPVYGVVLAQAQDLQAQNDPPHPTIWPYLDAANQTYSDFALQIQGWIGIRTDPKHVPKLRTKLLEEMATYESTLLQEKLLKPNGKTKDGIPKPPSLDTKVLFDLIRTTCAEHGIQPKLVKLKKGEEKAEEDRKLSRDEEALEAVSPFHPVLNLLTAYKKNQKVLGYIDDMKRGFYGPLFSQPNVLVANGRISWTTPNLTNMPRMPGVREAYLPPLGYVLGAIDYSQLELCTLAQVCIWMGFGSRMAELINARIDLHDTLAADYLHMSYEDFQKVKEEPFYERMRNAAKIGNFGFGGGMGIDKFMSNNRKAILAAGMTRADVVRLRETWFRNFPEMRRYMQDAAYVAKLVKQIVQFVSQRIRGGVGYSDTANGRFSGLAADGAKHAMRMIQRECWAVRESPAFGAYMVAFVHDEFVLALPQDRAGAMLDYLYEIAMRVMQAYCPDVFIKGSRALMLRWRKGAKEFRDSNGVLTPYEYSPKFAKRLAQGEEWDTGEDFWLDEDEAEGDFSDAHADIPALDTGSEARHDLLVPGSGPIYVRNGVLPGL